MYMFMKGSTYSSAKAYVLDTLDYTDCAIVVANQAQLQQIMRFKNITIMPFNYETFKEWLIKGYAPYHFSKVLDTYIDRDFIEITGSICGDVCTYRYYTNGRIGEK